MPFAWYVRTRRALRQNTVLGALASCLACSAAVRTNDGLPVGSTGDAAASGDSWSWDAALATEDATTVDAPEVADAGVSATPCASTASALVAPCAPVGLDCEYGNDPRRACNTTLTCAGDSWTQMKTYGDCAPVDPPGACPATYADGDSGASCSTLNAICVYPEGTCACSGGLAGLITNQWWWCWPAPSSPCPAVRPLAGTACSQAGTVCDYGSCYVPSLFDELSCSDGGYWVPNVVMCN